MGRPFGIPVYVSPTWFLVAALLTWTFAPLVARRAPEIGALRFGVSFLFAVLLYLSVLVHELSHSLVARHLGLPVRRISLHLLGGMSEIEREAPTPGREFLVAFAGPLLSLLLGGAGLVLARELEPGGVAALLAAALAGANLLVGAFNLLPGLPLDGGRVLQAAVWKLSGRRYTGIVVAGWGGRILAVVVLALPFGQGWLLDEGVSPVNIAWAALLASFVWFGASEALRVARLRERLPRLTARTLTRTALSVPADLPLAEALRRMSAAGARSLVVVDAGHSPVALVNEASALAVPEQRRPWVLVRDVARVLEPSLVLGIDAGGEALLRRLHDAPATEYLVLDTSGAVSGVLAAADVRRAVAR